MTHKFTTIEEVLNFLNNSTNKNCTFSTDKVINERSARDYIKMIISFNGAAQIGNYVFIKTKSEHNQCYIIGIYIDYELLCFEIEFYDGNDLIQLLSNLETKLKENFFKLLDESKEID
jgi:hypothetical protein